MRRSEHSGIASDPPGVQQRVVHTALPEFSANTTQRDSAKAAERANPVERDELYRMLVADMRSRQPESVSPLALGPPTDPAAIRDPRGRR